MINYKNFILTGLCICSLYLSASDSSGVQDLAQGLQAVREAAQKQADAQIKIFEDAVSTIKQEIAATEQFLNNNNQSYAELSQQHEAEIARLADKFQRDTHSNRQEDTRFKIILAELRTKLAQQEQAKDTFKNQTAQMIGEFVVVNPASDPKKRKSTPASVNGAPEQRPISYRKGDLVPVEFWNVLPEQLKPYCGTQETTI